MEELTPMEPTPPTSIMPETPPKNRRKLWIIGGVIAAVFIVLPALVALASSVHPSAPKPTVKTQIADADLLPKGTGIDPTKLPDAKKIFYTMLQRTATQSTIAGEYGEGYYHGAANPDAITEAYYEERSSSWKNGSISADYQQLPWDVSRTTYGLDRCLSGKRSSYLISPRVNTGWKSDTTGSAYDICKTATMVSGGLTNIDGVVTGGLTQNQATVWVDLLSGYKDSFYETPLFSFDAPTVTKINGKTVVGISFKMNAITNPDCDYKCGLPLLSQSLKKEHIDIDKLGYYDSLTDNTISGTYYIDPATVLPVQSRLTSYDESGATSNEYARTYTYTKPNFQKLPVMLPATQPALIADFKDVADDLPPPTD